MDVNGYIKKEIDDLINLMLTDGVQPNDLANNIFDEPYTSIKYEKVNGQIIGNVTFEEEFNYRKVLTTLRYFYNDSKQVIKIEEVTNRRRRVLWNREQKENEKLSKIICLMKEYHSEEEIEMFMNSLPNNLKNRLKQSWEISKIS